ncbi:Aste57867_23046 [Aphanomyces stellatus]|uniref:Aste57867_23046 protein n=1 Tax=Aphanomyces stellatus TaxID=120398 RepID=A0A485LNB4_9STRA|nr:hypothetical protein As57867_022975 [Aphanomyces stellatus]VFT99694.1 Aste57867_23046 [Aphanomyces stellatus]
MPGAMRMDDPLIGRGSRAKKTKKVVPAKKSKKETKSKKKPHTPDKKRAPSLDRPHDPYPALMAPEEDALIQGDDEASTDKNYDTKITSYYATCEQEPGVTLCTEKSTNRDYLCFSTASSKGKCKVHYVRRRAVDMQDFDRTYYSYGVNDEVNETGLAINFMEDPVRIDYLPRNMSMIDFHDLKGGLKFQNMVVPDGTNRLKNVQLTGYPTPGFSNITLPKSIVRINFLQNKITTFDPSDWKDSNLDEMMVENNLISTIGPVAFPSKLRFLNIRQNHLTDQSFHGTVFPATLRSLRLGNNQISSIAALPVRNLAHIERIGLRENKRITRLDKAAADALPPSLALFDLAGCSIAEITPDFYLPPAIKFLHLTDNNLTTIPSTLRFPHTLQRLSLDGNPIKSFDVSPDTFKQFQGLLAFVATSQHLVCGAGFEKKLVVNATYVCVGTGVTAVELANGAGSGGGNPRSGALPVVGIVSGVVGALTLAIVALFFMYRRRRSTDQGDDNSAFDSKSTPGTMEQGTLPPMPHVPTHHLDPMAPPPSGRHHQDTDVSSTDSSEVESSLDGYTSVAATQTSFGGYTATQVATSTLMRSSRKQAKVELPKVLTKHKDLTRLAIPPDELQHVHAFHGYVILSQASYDDARRYLEAATWNKHPVVLKPLLETKPAVRLRLLASLTHPNLILLYGVTWSWHDGDLKLVLEKVARGSLRSLLFAPHPPMWSLAEKLNMAADVATALLVLHEKNTIHHGLTDAHVYLTDTYQAKLGLPMHGHDGQHDGGDWEDATKDDPTRLLWIAPELLAGDQDATAAADMYSLGLLLSTLERQALPGDASTVNRLRDAAPPSDRRRRVSVVDELPDVEWFSPSCPEKLKQLGAQCLHLIPEDRPAAVDAAYTLRQLAKELADVAAKDKKPRTGRQSMDL